jgi:hypothetical protein
MVRLAARIAPKQDGHLNWGMRPLPVQGGKALPAGFSKGGSVVPLGPWVQGTESPAKLKEHSRKLPLVLGGGSVPTCL